MEARMKNPLAVVPGAMDAIQVLAKTLRGMETGISAELLSLRASQINGCAVCIDMHAKELLAEGMSDMKVLAVSALAGVAPLQRRRARRAGPGRGGHPDRRRRRGARPRVGGRRRPLHRGAARRDRARDRRHQLLQPHQRRHPPDRPGLDGPRCGAARRT